MHSSECAVTHTWLGAAAAAVGTLGGASAAASSSVNFESSSSYRLTQIRFKYRPAACDMPMRPCRHAETQIHVMMTDAQEGHAWKKALESILAVETGRGSPSDGDDPIMAAGSDSILYQQRYVCQASTTCAARNTLGLTCWMFLQEFETSLPCGAAVGVAG